MAITARKKFGQHWLRSDRVLEKILAAAAIEKDDCILEIGPGRGVLTRQLLAQCGRLLAVELDRDLVPKLIKEFGNRSNFLLLQGDFLDIDTIDLTRDFPEFQHPNKVVANIPYNITGPILAKLLGTISRPNPQPFSTIVLLVQKEVAERVCAKPHSRAFGALTIRTQYLAECEYITTVSAKDFDPPPKVESAVIKLSPRCFPQVADEPQVLESLVKQGFSSKRKMLRNNLQSTIDRDRFTHIASQLDFNPDTRAEDLSIPQWISLANFLCHEKNLSLTIDN
jgi:16S rRNA (adenine1518-N6/adenine1519-N6)-dimethyltransferase